jgi:hypothetical protein
MKFVLVTDRALKDSYCALCCEAIRAEYLRDLDTRLSYCDHRCYSGHLRMSVPFQESQTRGYREVRALPKAPRAPADMIFRRLESDSTS